ncbi:MAG: hypothetical protein DRO89_03465 [Candidatus Altiarchaeales archaeon]|nr:MAG: hypothetical protein DRO89_03465 [Candidatus Altiarchaeales archaeon]
MMDKKLVIIAIFVIGILLISGCVRRGKKEVSITKDQIDQKFSEFESRFREKLLEGYDLSGAGELFEKAKYAYQRGDYKLADKFLNDASAAVESAKKVEISIPGFSIPEEEINIFNDVSETEILEEEEINIPKFPGTGSGGEDIFPEPEELE